MARGELEGARGKRRMDLLQGEGVQKGNTEYGKEENFTVLYGTV
jgi:hypothetical protein